MANQICNSCGAIMDANSAFCANCGATKVNPVQQQYQSPPPGYVPPVQQNYYQQPIQPNYQNDLTQPLGVGQYIGMMILSGIPLVGFILLLVWAFGSSVNKNKKNYARAVLIVGIIGGIIAAIFSGVLVTALTSILSQYGSYY